MKSLKNMPENLETMTDSVQLRPLFSKFLITGAMFWFVCWQIQARLLIGWKVSCDQLALSLNLGIFRTDNPYVFKTVFNPSHSSLLLNPVFNSFPRTTVSYSDLPTFLKNVTNKIA